MRKKRREERMRRGKGERKGGDVRDELKEIKAERTGEMKMGEMKGRNEVRKQEDEH